MKRFYKTTSTEAVDGGWQVMLDARSVKTPGKTPLLVPSQELAAALADEWDAQDPEIVPDTMPLTQYACSAIDRVAPARGLIIDQVSAFVDTDLMADPTDEPVALRAKQDAAWNPILKALAGEGWVLTQTTGLMAIDQDPEMRPRARAWLEAQSDFALTALASLIEACGSFLLTHALARGLISIDELIAACTVEEHYNIAAWGSDEEAEQLMARREADLRSAAQMLNLLG